MLNELRRSEIFSSNFPWRATAFATSFIILFSPFSGSVGLKVAFLTDHWNKQGAKGREGIHQTFYTHHIMLKQYSCPCFICHHSIRGLRSLCTSLFKAKMMTKRKPSLNLSSPFHLCKSKGQFICCQIGYFSSPSDTSFLKWGQREREKELFSWHSANPCFFTHTPKTVFSLHVFSMKQGWLVGWGAAQRERRSEKLTRKTAAKGALSWSKKGLTKSTSRPWVTVI